MHVVVGAGVIGATTANLLAEAGERVRLISRSGGGPRHPDIELVAADATDADTLSRLAEGAITLYNCANPAYNAWQTDWPPLASALLTAAERSGATLAVTGNLYVYGPVDAPMTEDMPLAAPTRKGRVRVAMWRDAHRAHQDGRIKVTEVRASDFIGPRNSLLSLVVPALRAGRTAWVPAPLDVPHTFTYTGDVARALIALGRDERAWGRAWHVPSPPALTVRELITVAARIGGFGTPRIRRIPTPVLRAAGLVQPFVRELKEMEYQFERPFLLDATAAETTFGLRATDLTEAVRATVASSAPATRS